MLPYLSTDWKENPDEEEERFKGVLWATEYKRPVSSDID